MKIKQEIYLQMLKCPIVPPEVGGILGSREEYIDSLVRDFGINSVQAGIYIPNLDLLNQCIKKWESQNISFQGMFHTHAPNWSSLSGEDQIYIEKIMHAMPDWIERLYFPLVFPNQFVRGFCAIRTGLKVNIIEDNIMII